MYKSTYSQIIIRLTDNAFIPIDNSNRDYVEYLAWVNAGNTPQPADKNTQPRVIEIYSELDAIDRKCIRALRENDTARITQYEQQAEALRVELRSLLA
jgi:hypothetical protein